MDYKDPLHTARSFRLDVGSHAAIWRQFRSVTGSWPKLSILAYIMRFIAILVCVIVAIWYGERHSLTKGQGGLICLAIALPVLGAWFLVEIQIWNYELRQKGISSRKDIWKTDQFPEN